MREVNVMSLIIWERLMIWEINHMREVNMINHMRERYERLIIWERLMIWYERG